MSRALMVVGNWKMHKTRAQAAEFILQLSKHTDLQHSGFYGDVYLAVPSTAIAVCSEKATPLGIHIGAQNLSEHVQGAYTGEISAEMVEEAGATFALVGHSERRALHHETSVLTSHKIRRCLERGLKAIFCIGETQEQRVSGKTNEVLQTQLKLGLEGLKEEEFRSISIAYEPVWAIGTGHTATPEMAQEVHQMCRNFLKHHIGLLVSENISILYGGSVTEKTIEGLILQKDIDGVLVGGASLSVESFAKIITISREMKK